MFSSHDVLDLQVEFSIRNFLTSGRVQFVWLGMPYTTFSRARCADGLGPGPLRDDEHIWGLPCLNSSAAAKLRLGNKLFLFTLRIARLCDELRIPWVIENPLSSMAWKVPSMRRFLSHSNASECNLDGCVFGEDWKKPTKLVYKFLNLHSIARRCESSNHICTRTGQPHIPLKGLSANGKFMTLVAQPYPWQLVHALSDLIAKTLCG